MKKIYQFILADKHTILSFLTVGSITAGINFILFSICFGFFHLYYQIAVSIAFIIGVLFHFNANRYFTFKSQAVSFQQQIPRYVVLLMIGYLSTLTITYSMVEMGHFSPYVGYVVAIGVTVGINYLLSRFWVFAVYNKGG